MNARPRHHHYLVHTTVPPLRNVPRCRFTRRARNRATAARFRIFDPNPLLASHFANARPHHHHYLVCTTTPPLRNVPHRRFTRHTRNRATAARFRIFDPNSLLASHFANARPHHHHHLVCTTTPPLCNVLHRHFTRRTRNRATAARFRIFDPNLLLASHFANARPHDHHLVCTTTPPPFTALHLHFRWHARNRAPVARFPVLSPWFNFFNFLVIVILV